MTCENSVEFHVTDICNLNCNGCSHFAPMVRSNTCTYDSFKKDIQRLAELFNNIKHIRLLGGEPFLEENLCEYIITARKHFPYSDIQVVTNGLLALCSGPIVLQHFNDYYKKKYVCRNSTINIHQSDVTAEKILDFLSMANDSCKYCGTLQEEKWSKCLDLRNIDMRYWVTNIPIKKQ